MSAQPKLKYTLEEYLELDRNSEERLEYWDGEVFSMSGASRQHDRITVDFVTYLNSKLIEKGCEAFSPDMRIKVPSLPPYRYCEYLLVAQHRPYVTQYIKKGDGFWLQREYNSLDEVVRIEALDCELPMKQIYRRVTFVEPTGLGEII